MLLGPFTGPRLFLILPLVKSLPFYKPVVCYTAVFSVVTQRPPPPPTSGEERCVTTIKTAV